MLVLPGYQGAVMHTLEMLSWYISEAYRREFEQTGWLTREGPEIQKFSGPFRALPDHCEALWEAVWFDPAHNSPWKFTMPGSTSCQHVSALLQSAAVVSCNYTMRRSHTSSPDELACTHAGKGKAHEG